MWKIKNNECFNPCCGKPIKPENEMEIEKEKEKEKQEKQEKQENEKTSDNTMDCRQENEKTQQDRDFFCEECKETGRFIGSPFHNQVCGRRWPANPKEIFPTMVVPFSQLATALNVAKIRRFVEPTSVGPVLNLLPDPSFAQVVATNISIISDWFPEMSEQGFVNRISEAIDFFALAPNACGRFTIDHDICLRTILKPNDPLFSSALDLYNEKNGTKFSSSDAAVLGLSWPTSPYLLVANSGVLNKKEKGDDYACTFKVTGREFLSQWWFHCKSCHKNPNEGHCYLCAWDCQQKNHELVVSYGGFFCDKGAAKSDMANIDELEAKRVSMKKELGLLEQRIAVARNI